MLSLSSLTFVSRWSSHKTRTDIWSRIILSPKKYLYDANIEVANQKDKYNNNNSDGCIIGKPQALFFLENKNIYIYPKKKIEKKFIISYPVKQVCAEIKSLARKISRT